MPEVNRRKRVLIVGGGFGGLAAALALAKKKPVGLKITLVSDKSYFEYTPALYRVVTGRSPLAVGVPLREILAGKRVEILEDAIVEVDLSQKLARGKSGVKYNFDFLILALGSETAYFDIPGLKEFSFGFKSITEALKLKQHLHELSSNFSKQTGSQKINKTNIVIVGGGASGVELAGELAFYAKTLAKTHCLAPSWASIDLIEASPRLLPTLPEAVSERIQKRLRRLGVKIFPNRAVMDEEIKKVHLRDMEMKTETVVWTAGVKPHHLFAGIPGLELDKENRVAVDDYLQSPGRENVFVIGDGAATPYSGLAQTAIYDAKFVADIIMRKISGRELKPYRAKKPAQAIPVGPGWAAVIIGPFVIYGKIGWWLRRLADLRFFIFILPPAKALLAFRNGQRRDESCALCQNEDNK